MIWATVSSQFCFCWLYRASPSLAGKNIINLISVLTIWWCPCVGHLLCCWKRVFVMTNVFPCLCPAFIFISKAKLTCYSRYLLTSYFCISVPYDEKDIFFGLLVLEGLVGLYICTSCICQEKITLSRLSQFIKSPLKRQNVMGNCLNSISQTFIYL